MKLSLRFCLPLLAVVPLAALAQPKKAAPPVAQKAADAGGQVDITNAPDGTGTYDDAQEIARLTKDVVITQRGENLVIYAQQATFSRKLNQASASGQLRVVTRDSTIRGLNLRADFNQRQFTISGSVVITSHGKNDGAAAGLRGEANKKPIRVLCNQVVWDYDTKQATATGNIQIFQGKNKGTCEKIVYDEDKNIVILTGNVQFGDDQNRTFIGQEIRVYIDDNTVATDKRIRLKFPEKAGMNGSNPDGGAPRPQKTTVPIAPRPTIAPNILDEFKPQPTTAATPAPVPTEEPVPTPVPDEPAEEEPKN